jgi:hypothetical protein
MSDSVFEQGNKLIDICAEERAQRYIYTNESM